MKFILVSLLFVSSAFAFETQFELSVQKLERDADLKTMKEELMLEAKDSCRIREHQGIVKRITGWEVVVIPERDRSADSRCEWRGSCYVPALVSLSAEFHCEID